MDKQVSFTFNGYSSKDFYMYIENSVSFPTPEQDVTLVEVLGRDGDLVIDNQRLKSVDFPVPVIVRPPSHVRLDDLATDIARWLKSELKWSPLMFGSRPQYEYEAMITSSFDIERTIMNHGRTVLTFRLKPHKQRVGQTGQEIKNGGRLFNREIEPSLPLIEIKGSGQMKLFNNGKLWLNLQDVQDEITIDSELMSVYEGSRPAYLRVVDSNEFPKLESGVNVITWEGGVSSVTIHPRWRAVI